MAVPQVDNAVRNIRMLLRKKEISMEQFGEILGAAKDSSRQNKYKKAKRTLADPSDVDIALAASALGVTTDFLYGVGDYSANKNSLNNSFNKEISMNSQEVLSALPRLSRVELEKAKNIINVLLN